MKQLILFFLTFLFCFSFQLHAQDSGEWPPESTEWYYPAPQKVKPGINGSAPSDAIVLFDGSDFSKWTSENGAPVEWKIVDGTLQVEPGTGGIITKEFFGDCQLHIEFRSPDPENYHGQNRGNSGIMLQRRYEVQVLDGDNNETYVNGMVGSIYKQSAPAVNAYTKNGEWQVYDIYYKAPRFGTNDQFESPAMITVVLNGILIQNNFILKGHTPYVGLPKYEPHGRLPLFLQDHGTKVAYRNIWIRNL
ncbi:protein of unknown function [Mariniphaga anaerophila]|uniref:3-keto-alpha-glucoside-1,2-lyase/3-keto-2-hydroxy-glucal hydratase domain-containing protein n=1 Tax=Mariniphaga anaerophila TaxID=1484053 RepID=A0A1M4XJ11_9BACT|nr:DUF1080 domain-containing protein [Mariniphaga anaerophila]SHE93647.1 protein of unknown function [Mariniphaga anaerophila]